MINTRFQRQLKLLIPFFFLASISCSCFSQITSTARVFHYGFKLNPTFGYIHVNGGPGLSGDGLKLGFSAGVTGDYLFAKNISLSAQLNITTINGGQNFKSLASPAANVRTLFAVRYLELPLAIKFKTRTIGDGSRFYFKTGLDPSLKLSEKGTQNITVNGTVNILGDKNLGKQLNSFRFGALAGAGYDYQFNRYLTFTSGLVFNHGLNNVSQSTQPTISNSYLAIEFGIYF